MSNKIPCGGFYLSDTLGMDENGKLGVNGGEPYKSLVTDGSGNAKWEDRLAYEDSRVVIENAETGLTLVRISDEIPSWASINVPMKLWLRRTRPLMLDPEYYMDFGNGSFGAPFVFFIANDNSFVSSGGDSLTFPKKGVYIMNPIPLDGLKKDYVVGISTVESDTPEITWDGSIEIIKKIDEKFLPDQLILYAPEIGDRTGMIQVYKNEDASNLEYASVEEVQRAFFGRGVFIKMDGIYVRASAFSPVQSVLDNKFFFGVPG